MRISDLKRFKPDILAKGEEYGVFNIRVALPSDGRDTDGDITLVVDTKPGLGWEFFGFAEDVEKMLECDLNVLTDDLAADKWHKPYIGNIVPL